jgi:hypothetical protein
MSWAAVTVLSLGATVSVTACTSNGEKPAPEVAGDQGKQNEQGKTQNPKDVAEAYAKCMREQGQEVKVDEGGISVPGARPGEEDKAGGAGMAEAMEKCDKQVPGMKQQKEKANPKALKQNRGLAECLRGNGIPNMPDPDPKKGGLTVPKDAAGDKWTKAMSICGDKFPGAVFVMEETQ